MAAIYLFANRVEESNAPRIEDLPASPGLLELVQNTYMNSLLDREQRAHEFDVLSRIAAQVPLRRIVPHQDPGKLGALCDVILADAQKIADRQKSPALAPQH